MIQTPVLDSAQPTVKDLNDNGPYHTASTPKTQGISANLRDRLENQKNSETLNLADMFLGDEGAHELAESLHHHGDFASIQLRGNNISAAGFAVICQHLHNCPKLRELAAEWNNIGSDPAGVTALHKFARTSNSLHVIDLKNNRIGPNCGKALGDLIRDSNSLNKLDLRWNELGEEGGQQILNALQDSRKKIAFELNGNRIPEQILVQINQFSSSGAVRTAAPAVTAATTVNTITSPTATKITIFDQPAKRMAQLTGERLFQSQFGQTAAAHKEEKQHKNIVDDFTNKPQHHEPYSLGNTLPNKYSNLNTVTHATTAANENRFGTTSKKSHEKTDYISDKYIYNSAIHGAGSHGHGPAHTLRVDTHSDVRTVTLGQDNFSSASLREGGLSQKYSYGQEIKAKTYSSPLRGLEGDVDAQIETTKKNIERYSPTHKGRLANAHEFRHERHETMSRPSYEMKTEVVRRSGTKVDSPPVREDKGSSSIHQKYKSGTQTSEFRTESMRRSAGVTHEHDVHSVQVRHVVDDGSLKVGKLISDLERTVEIEREKAREAQMKLDAAVRDLEIESRGRQEAEKKHSYILEELRRRDVEVNELRIKVDGLSQDNNGLSLEVRSVRAENEKLAEFNRVGMVEIEEKYIRQLKQADEHSRSLRDQLGSVQRDLNMQIVEIRGDYDGRIRNYDEQVREFSRLNDELSNELANQLEFIEKLKVEQEENLKRTIVEVREEEVRRAQPVIRQLEDEVRTLKITNEDLTAKNAEMLHDLQAYERQMREQHMQFATELNRLGSEHDRVRGELNQANITIQRLNGEISMRNTAIKNLEGDIDRLRMEIQRQADMYVSQIENLKRDFESERRRFAEQERQLIYKIEDTERRLVESQNETVMITREYDRLVEIMQGNVSKAIHDTFVTHKHTSEIRHIEHKSVPVRSVLDERQVLATSRVFNTAEKKYM